MGKTEIPIGVKINKLTILRASTKRDKSGAQYVECVCECGKLRHCRLSDMLKGKSKSCGCSGADILRIDETNKKYGMLRVVKHNKETKKWVVVCECGNIEEKSGAQLRSGRVVCCSQCKWDSRRKSYIGKVNGRLTIIEQSVNTVAVRCTCGNELEMTIKHWNTKHRKSCGCIAKERQENKIFKTQEDRRRYYREYYRTNKLKMRVYRQTHKQTEKYKATHKANKQKRRVREKNAGTFTGKEWLELKAKYDYTCLCCGAIEPRIKLSVDHVIPLSLGGSNTIDNIQPLCVECNTKKGTRVIDYRAK